MKITIRQLKQLIKEQVEEGWSDKDSSLDAPAGREEPVKRATRPMPSFTYNAEQTGTLREMLEDLLDMHSDDAMNGDEIQSQVDEIVKLYAPSAQGGRYAPDEE